MNAGAKVSF